MEIVVIFIPERSGGQLAMKYEVNPQVYREG
jgi:hypothetical protein